MHMYYAQMIALIRLHRITLILDQLFDFPSFAQVARLSCSSFIRKFHLYDVLHLCSMMSIHVFAIHEDTFMLNHDIRTKFDM